MRACGEYIVKEANWFRLNGLLQINGELYPSLVSRLCMEMSST